MTEQERLRIMSNDYADLIVEYNTDKTVFERFSDATVQYFDINFAILHVPVSQITSRVINIYGYSIMPHCFGLLNCSSSLEASGITKLRNIPGFSYQGSGVIVGIIDTGIDYTNPIFQNADKTTKIAAIWDQTIDSEYKAPKSSLGTDYYGTEFLENEINQALSSPNPLSIVPTTDEIGHGTMLAGIIAGSEVPEQNFCGVVPSAKLVVVKLKTAKQYLKDFFLIPDEAVCYQDTDLLFAHKYVREVAARLNSPVAICIAVGTSQGGHDGRGILMNYMSLWSNVIGNATIVAAGNEGKGKRHYYGEIDPKVGYDIMEINVGQEEKGFAMEIWGDIPNVFSIDLQSPAGEYIARIPARIDQYEEISFIFEKTKIFIDYRLVEIRSGAQLILVRFIDSAPGVWRLRVYGRGDLTSRFHAWLPMEHFISSDTYFIRSNPDTTVLSLGNTRNPITVTAYNPEDGSIYQNASRGYSRTGMITPQIAAPGVNMIVPTLQQGFAEVSGTSVAAAHTTGAAAMMLEWGIIKGKSPGMNSTTLKNYMVRGAKRSNQIEYPNTVWGAGILDVYNIFNSLRSEVSE